MRMKNHFSYFLVSFLFGIVLFSQAQTVIKIPFQQNAVFEVIPASFDASLEPNGSLEIGLEATISGGSGNYTFSWVYNDEIVSNNPTLTISKAGSYLFVVNDGGGCQSSILYNISGDTRANAYDFKSLVNIYPNPSNGLINVELPNNFKFTSANIYSIDGKLLKSFGFEDVKSDNSLLSFNLSDLSSGYYLISFITRNEKLTKVITLKK